MGQLPPKGQGGLLGLAGQIQAGQELVLSWLEGAGPSTRARALGNELKLKPGKEDLQKLQNSPEVMGVRDGIGINQAPLSVPAPAPPLFLEHLLFFLKNAFNVDTPQGQSHAVSLVRALGA